MTRGPPEEQALSLDLSVGAPAYSDRRPRRSLSLRRVRGVELSSEKREYGL